VTRAERVGILTTPAGTRKLVLLLSGTFREQAARVMGEAVLADLESRTY